MAEDDRPHFREGINSRQAGIRRGENPHPRWTSEWVAWLAGWNVSEEERVAAEQEHSQEQLASRLEEKCHVVEERHDPAFLVAGLCRPARR